MPSPEYISIEVDHLQALIETAKQWLVDTREYRRQLDVMDFDGMINKADVDRTIKEVETVLQELEENYNIK